MKTIETDMKCTFFVQDGSIMVPTKEAEKLYIEAKKIITDFESIYRAKNVDTKDIQVITNADRVQNTIESAVGNITNAVDVKINDMQNVLESKNKQLEGTIDKIKTILNTSPKAKKKYLFVVLSFFIISACFYLNKTNFLFYRDLYNNASNGLQAIMRDNYQDISDHKPCSFAVMQMNIDMYSLIDKLTKKSKYKDLSAMIFMIKSEPLISMRFSGDEKSDSILNTNKLIPCDTQKAYTESAKLFKKTQELFARDKNFKIYNFYYNLI
jgi:predicted metal-dependent hydrolase